MLLQETHTNQTNKETRRMFIWFFSGDQTDSSQHTFAGVAIVIRNELLNYVLEVALISARLMHISLGYTILLCFINVYMHPADHTTQQKEEQCYTVCEASHSTCTR